MKTRFLILSMLVVLIVGGLAACNRTPVSADKYNPNDWLVKSTSPYSLGYAPGLVTIDGDTIWWPDSLVTGSPGIQPVGPKDHPWGGDNQRPYGPTPSTPIFCDDDGSFVVVSTNCGPAGGGGFYCVRWLTGPMIGQVTMLDPLVLALTHQCGELPWFGPSNLSVGE
jgi:hypothetical protein